MQKLIIKLFLLIFLTGCAKIQIKRNIELSKDDFKKLDWQNKVEIFEKADENQLPSPGIYEAAFKESSSTVVLAALESIPERLSVNYKQLIYPLLKYDNPVVRWKACKVITLAPESDDLPFLASDFKDKDWMVKQCIFHSIPKYEKEKSAKKYFFNVISALFETNPQVLREVFKTLKWYDDDRAFSFMYKRSFHAENSTVLIVIMQELKYYNNDLVRQRFYHLSKNSPDYFVREEAKNILAGM